MPRLCPFRALSAAEPSGAVTPCENADQLLVDADRAVTGEVARYAP